MPNIYRQDSAKFACGKGAGMFIIKLKTTQKPCIVMALVAKRAKNFCP